MSSSNKKYLLPALAVGGAVTLGTLLWLNRRHKQPTLLSDIDYLTKELCQARRRLLAKPHAEYDLLLVFPAKEDHYFGELEVKFDLAEAQTISLDFQKKGLVEMAINRRKVLDPRALLSSDQLVLPSDFLQVGENVVQVKFKNQFDKNQFGLIRGDDGTIHAVTCGYLPSLIFPCFDQPDIKATIKLRVMAAEGRKVIANEKLTAEEPAGSTEYLPDQVLGVYRMFEFARTKLLPIHDFTVFIGDFVVFKAKRNWKAVPVTFHFRPETKAKLEGRLETLLADIEVVVHKTLDYFATHFGLKYPFSKLDVVYTETPAPAIEYPGAILMGERYLEDTDLFLKTDHLVVLSHEIIHMWFGNIVTCDFWDNIFIHESFAEYLSFVIYQTFAKNLSGQYQDPAQYVLFRKTYSSLVAASLPGARAVKSDLTDLQLANTIFDTVVYHKGEHLLAYFHEQWKDGFHTLLQRVLKEGMWGNIGYKQFLALIPEGNRNKFKHAFENKVVDVVEVQAAGAPGHYKAVRTVNSGLTWEQIGVTFYDLTSQEAKVVRIDLHATETDFSVPEGLQDYAFVFNQHSKAFCIWKDEPANAAKVTANADKLPDLDVLNYFLNLANYFTLRSEDPDLLLNFFKAVFPAIKRANFQHYFKLLRRVLVHKTKDTRLAEEAFRFLMSQDEPEGALMFMSTRVQAETFAEVLDQTHPDNQALWKAYICQTHKVGLKDLSAKALAEFDSKFKDPQFAEYRAVCSSETIDNEFMGLIMYRTGNKNLRHYIALLSFMKAYLPEAKRVQLATRFVKDFQSIARQVSKFYVQAVLKLVVPAARTEAFPELMAEFRKAAAQVSTNSFLSHILTQRMQMVALYND